ncbi:hypothetical protein Areg01_46470 [Actinoplanes regularis]|nr:hypothetical protein Areg01_46470 [Actinoplanes regularis]
MLAISEIKWGETMGPGHVDRLRPAAGPGPARRAGRPAGVLQRRGLHPEPRDAAAENPAIVLVGPADLYRSGAC